ncbi:MAG: hypothetical protein ACAH95_18355 [Fimbriimonas sp.]
MSIGAIALRIVGALVLIAVLALVLYPAFSPKTSAPQHSACYIQMRQCAIGLSMYSADNDDVLPARDTWMDATFGYSQTNENFHCTAMESPGEYGIALNSALIGVKIVPDRDVALVFDSSVLTRNATAPLSSAPNPGRHGGYDVVGFVDTHVRAVRDEEMTALGKPVKQVSAPQ